MTLTGWYPELPAHLPSLTEAAWEAEFSVAAAAKSARCADTLYVALRLSRAFWRLAELLHAQHCVWCLIEKGALATGSASPLPRGAAPGRVERPRVVRRDGADRWRCQRFGPHRGAGAARASRSAVTSVRVCGCPVGPCRAAGCER